MEKYLIYYILIINVIGFAAMAADKKISIRNGKTRGRKMSRFPEKSLMAIAVFGGSVGCILGMKLLRHKTKHRLFTLGLPLILACQILLSVLYFLCRCGVLRF